MPGQRLLPPAANWSFRPISDKHRPDLAASRLPVESEHHHLTEAHSEGHTSEDSNQGDWSEEHRWRHCGVAQAGAPCLPTCLRMRFERQLRAGRGLRFVWQPVAGRATQTKGRSDGVEASIATGGTPSHWHPPTLSEDRVWRAQRMTRVRAQVRTCAPAAVPRR
jgi:hypothetical protein